MLWRDDAQRLDLRAALIDTSWETIPHELAQNRYDFIVRGITITPERRRLLAWSIPYMTTSLSLVIDSARSPAAMAIADLKDDIVGVQDATTDYDAAVAMKKLGTIRGVTVYPFARIADAVADLRHGTIGERGVRDSSSVSI